MKRTRSCLGFVGRLALYLVWGWLTLALVWPLLARWLDNSPTPRPGLTNYLIVAPLALEKSAHAWADYRRATGYAVYIVFVSPTEATVPNIRQHIQRVYTESGRPYPFYVLLLGHAQVWDEGSDSYLPAASVPLDLPQELINEIGSDHIASDDAYALENDVLLPIAFGRVPAWTEAEALRVLARTQAYEATPPTGLNRTQVELIASESLFGPVFDQAIEKLVIFFVEEHLPTYYRWHMLYGHPDSPYAYPAPEFPGEVARRLDQGAVLATYIGHGSSDWLGPALGDDGWEGPVFTASDVSLVNDAQASLVTMIACSAGEYDQSRSLAEELLLKPGGAVATYAASRLTLPAANTILGKDLFRVLLAGQARTAGEWIRLAESNYKNPGSDEALSLWLLTRAIPPAYELAIWGNESETPPLDAELVYGLQQHAYNLFGDPALALALPRPELKLRPNWAWLPLGGRLAFSGENDSLVNGQVVTVTLYTRQSNLLPRAGPAGDLATRYQNANDKTVAQAGVSVNADGKFGGEFSLSTGLPSGRYILEAVAVNANTTLVGAHVVYIGWPPVGELLGSAGFWWLVFSVGLVELYRRRTKGPLTVHPG